MSTVSGSRPDVSTLRSNVSGRLVLPADADYDAMRQVVYGGIDKRPAVIVVAANASDVQAAVDFAREARLELAVRSGGHSGAGHSVSEGGLVIDLRDLNKHEIDEAAGTAWVEPGLTAGAFCTAAAEHGLIVGFGDAGTVGIGGITTGGGVGYLTRKFGLTIDSLLAADVVLADGSLVRTDPQSHPDLFWAIRGGGGNFGVVTRLQFRLHPLPAFAGGMMVLPATPETIAGFIAAAAAAPEELSTIANVMPAPPMPFLAPELHGQLVILGMLAFAGEPAAAEEALAPFRKLATPLADFVKPGAFAESMYPDEGGGEDYHPLAVFRTLYVDSLRRPTAEMILERLGAAGTGMRVAQLRVLGGAAARVPMDATAYGHRGRAIMINVAAFYEGEADKPQREKWVADFAEALAPGDPAGYVNFLGDEGTARVRAAYPGATWERLRHIKARYDPANLFRLNQNIPPA